MVERSLVVIDVESPRLRHLGDGSAERHVRRQL